MPATSIFNKTVLVKTPADNSELRAGEYMIEVHDGGHKVTDAIFDRRNMLILLNDIKLAMEVN